MAKEKIEKKDEETEVKEKKAKTYGDPICELIED
jgi:hypothetical protein